MRQEKKEHSKHCEISNEEEKFIIFGFNLFVYFSTSGFVSLGRFE